jgi:hypothetical protein
MRPSQIDSNGNEIVTDSRAHGDSIEVEFQEILTIHKLPVDAALDDSTEQADEDEDSLFKSFTGDQQQEQSSDEKIMLQPELPRISIHVGYQDPTTKQKKTKIVPNLILESLVATVDVPKREPRNDRTSNDRSHNDNRKSSSKTNPAKPTSHQNRRSRVLTILEDLDTKSITASSRTSCDDTTVQGSTARTSSDDSSSPYDLNSSSFSISTASFPADPTPSTSYIPFKIIDKKNTKKISSNVRRPIEYFAADEISIIDDGGCEGPNIPDLLTAFSQSEFGFQKFTPRRGMGQRELRILPDNARNRSLLSVDSSVDGTEFDVPAAALDRTHSSTSSSFGCSTHSSERRDGVPKSISTPTIVTKTIEEPELQIQTHTIELSPGAISNPVQKYNATEREFVSNTSRSSGKGLQLWKLPMLSFSTVPSIDSVDDNVTDEQQQHLQGQADTSIEISDCDFKDFNKSIPVDLDDVVEEENVDVVNENSTLLQVSKHGLGNGIGKTFLEDCGSAIEATISEHLEFATPNYNIDMTSIAMPVDDNNENFPNELVSPIVSTLIQKQQHEEELMDNSAMNDYDGANSEASLDYDSFIGDDEVMNEDNDDQVSIDTTNWASKVHNELERIAAIVRSIDAKNKDQEYDEKESLKDCIHNSPNESNTETAKDINDDDNNSKYHQMSTTSEIRESRQVTKFFKPSTLRNEQMLLDSSHSYCSDRDSIEQYDYFVEAAYNNNNSRPKLGRRLRVVFGGCLKSRAHSSLGSWNGTHLYTRTDNTTIAGTTVRMTNKKSTVETIASTSLETRAALDPTSNDDDCSSTQLMTKSLLTKTDSDHIRKYLLVDSEHSGTSSKSCFRRPKWLV